jgi:hypothetical protein
VAALVAAVVVFAAAGGFLLGRATADHHDGPPRVGRDWNGPGPGFDGRGETPGSDSGT